MSNPGFMRILGKQWFWLVLAIIIGLTSYSIRIISCSPLADPLLLSLIMAITFRTIMGNKKIASTEFKLGPRLFIPLGVVFYAVRNLNFVRFAQVSPMMIVLLIVIILVYFSVIILLGKLLGQKKEITFLTATGSAICGASAIAITTPAVDADPDDVSISLLSVMLAALLGLFIFLPFFATLCNITNKDYGVLCASVLQFTGFVEAASKNVPFLKEVIGQKDLTAMALSVKAVRYLGLLIAIPLFASLMKKRFHLPLILWLFLGAGIVGTWLHVAHESFYVQTILPSIRPVYHILWSIAMASIGLNANIKRLLSNNGTKALIMAFCGFMAATLTFFIGFCFQKFL